MVLSVFLVFEQYRHGLGYRRCECCKVRTDRTTCKPGGNPTSSKIGKKSCENIKERICADSSTHASSLIPAAQVTV